MHGIEKTNNNECPVKPRAQLIGFTQTVGIVTALLSLARVGLPRWRASLPSPSLSLVLSSSFRPPPLLLVSTCSKTFVIIQLLSSLVYIDSAEEVESLFEVELQKPRNLSAIESEERGHGEGVGVYVTLTQSGTL